MLPDDYSRDTWPACGRDKQISAQPFATSAVETRLIVVLENRSLAQGSERASEGTAVGAPHNTFGWALRLVDLQADAFAIWTDQAKRRRLDCHHRFSQVWCCRLRSRGHHRNRVCLGWGFGHSPHQNRFTLASRQSTTGLNLTA